jgi:hypothetical protein
MKKKLIAVLLMCGTATPLMCGETVASTVSRETVSSTISEVISHCQAIPGEAPSIEALVEPLRGLVEIALTTPGVIHANTLFSPQSESDLSAEGAGCAPQSEIEAPVKPLRGLAGIALTTPGVIHANTLFPLQSESDLSAEGAGCNIEECSGGIFWDVYKRLAPKSANQEVGYVEFENNRESLKREVEKVKSLADVYALLSRIIFACVKEDCAQLTVCVYAAINHYLRPGTNSEDLRNSEDFKNEVWNRLLTGSYGIIRNGNDYCFSNTAVLCATEEVLRNRLVKVVEASVSKQAGVNAAEALVPEQVEKNAVEAFRIALMQALGSAGLKQAKTNAQGAFNIMPKKLLALQIIRECLTEKVPGDISGDISGGGNC